MKTKSQFCKRGHDTLVTGRYDNSTCKLCLKEKNAQRYFDDPEKCKGKSKEYYKTHKKKHKELRKRWRSSNKERCDRNRHNWQLKNPQKTKDLSRKSSWKQHGIINLDGSDFTVINYDRLYQVQCGRCSICMKHVTELPRSKKTLVVDHDHKTGFVRGLLCDPCNRSLGWIENIDFVEKATNYLLKYIKISEGIS